MAIALSKDKFKDLPVAVQDLISRFSRIEEYWQPAVINMHENWRYYWGLYPHLGQGQWPASSIPKMLQSGRQLTQYNLILPIIDSLLSLLIKMPVEPQFIPLDDVGKQLSDLAMHMMYSDREIMDWSVAFRKFALFGLIFEGVMKMTVSDRYDPLGNIGFENCPQGSVFFDPFWKSGLRKDLKRVYKKSWMSAEDIWRIYRAERAGLQARFNKAHGEEYGPFLGINPYDICSTNTLGTMHIVFEEYFMDIVEHKAEIISGPDGDMEMPDIPDEDKPAYMDHFLPGWDKTMVREETEKIEECFLRTACPTMTGNELLVEKERTEVQIGSPPFFKWAANFENGQSRGMVDSLKDPQTNGNFLEAEILRKIQAEGGGGGKFVDESLFLNTREAEKFRLYSNRPDMKFKVKPGTLRKGLTPSHPVETTGVPSTMYENIQHIQRDVIPGVSKRPPVTMGQMEGKNNPAKLFELLGMEADNQTDTMTVSIRDFWKDAFEAYLLQCGQTYSNEMLPREFTYKKKTLIANMPVEMKGGGVIIANDVRGLMKVRHKIIISERQASPSDKANTANQLLSYMEKVPQEALGTRSVINHEVIKNIQQLDDETQKKLEEMADLEQKLAKAKLNLELANVEAQTMQVKQGVEQMKAQAAQQAAQQAEPVLPVQQGPSYELPQNENTPPQGGEQPINQGVPQ